MLAAPGLTVRAHVPAQVAAVLEDLAADAALVRPPVVPPLPELPPGAVAAGENQTPLEGEAAALMMGEPARLDKQRRKTGETGHGASPRLPPSRKDLLPNRPGSMGDEGRAQRHPGSGASMGRAPCTSKGTGGFLHPSLMPSRLDPGRRGPRPGLRFGQRTTCAPASPPFPISPELFFYLFFFIFHTYSPWSS